MSRPQGIHKPIKASFNNILSAIAGGTGQGKKSAQKAAQSATVKAKQADKPKSGGG